MYHQLFALLFFSSLLSLPSRDFLANDHFYLTLQEPLYVDLHPQFGRYLPGKLKMPGRCPLILD